MKTSILFTLAFILFALKANSDSDPVLDDQGNYLRTGVEYYLIPVFVDSWVGSSLGPAPMGNNTCPAGIFQFGIDGAGKPLTITPVDPKKGVIRLSTDVNIKFTGSAICHESNVWKLKYDKDMKQHVVMMGGVEGNPGPDTLDNWFKIEKAWDEYDQRVYKFVYCPSVCSSCKVMCKDIGTNKDGPSRLVLGGEIPLKVQFWA